MTARSSADDAAAPRRPEAVLNALLAGRTDVAVAAAESCTGGEVGHRIVTLAGSSDYFLGSIVAYANAAKANLLGVPQAVLASVGAVSPECARAMADGARAAYGARIAVSTTGIAGPGGATARKPVGLVYVGLAAEGEATIAEEHVFPGDRAAVIDAAAQRALELIVAAAERAVAGR